MCTCVLHAVRDPRCDGREVRRLPRASFLLSSGAEWWSSYFDATYLLEHAHYFDEAAERSFVARLIDIVGLPSGARVLDCPCGQGRHARLLAEAGFQVDAADLSGHLLGIARAHRTKGSPRYRRCDMRALPRTWSARFDCVLNLFSSFGFFLDPREDVKVVREFSRVLKPGGVLVWHGGNRDVIPARFPVRDWWTAPDGTLFAQERSFDQLSGVLTVATTWKRESSGGEREHRIRLYNATQLSEMFAAHGLIVEHALDGDRSTAVTRGSSTMLIVARKEG